ncbi:MAG: hypothetical protein ACRD4O_05155 [Bryobacteraceae bacterium]
MGGSIMRRALALAVLGLSAGVYATAGGAAHWVNFAFPSDSPVLVSSFTLGPTTARVEGSSMALDLHALLMLRNTGTKPISGLTLRVEAQDLTPGGKGSVTIPNLDAQPGDSFPVHINMELRRPFGGPPRGGAILKISLDCALFSDLTAYGPNTLGSHRALLLYEMEARRDRRYLAHLLETGRTAEVRRELSFGLGAVPEQLGLELLRNPGANAAHEQAVKVGALSFPGAPVEPIGGAARVFQNEVTGSRVEVVNHSRKTVRSIDMGWIVRDERGREFVAGAVPSFAHLAPVQTATMAESGTLRFSHPAGEPMSIGALMAFVNDVEFADGKLWIPTRADIQAATSDPILRRQLAASPEQQHLADVYRKKGLAGLEEELKKVQ